ncbi:MAG: (deoxy)nucleoside triphosphate pyrophosphohydrolase [Spirochaetia bacterium]
MIDVVAAVIQRNGAFLIAQRRGGSLHGKWEFPGGKVEPGENHHEALEREISEEFSVRIRAEGFVAASDFSIGGTPARLHAYFAEYISGDFNPADHQAVQWVLPAELVRIDFAPPDVPIAEQVAGVVGWG